MSEFVDNLKAKISGLFASKTAPVTIGKEAVLDRLGVKDHKFVPSPEFHSEVMKYTNRSWLNPLSDHTGTCRSYCANPDNQETSAVVSFSSETIVADKKNFALTIHNDSTGMARREDGMVFGLYGHYKAGDDTLVVDKIIAPERDNRNCIGDAYEIGVSPETLEKAMVFAALCAKDVYERGRINVRACFDAAERTKTGLPSAVPALKA